MSEKVEITIEKTDRGIEWTSPEGDKQEYRIPIRSFHLEVQKLSLIQTTGSIYLDKESFGKDANLIKRFNGEAILQDYGVEVIGDKKTKSRNISIELGIIPSEVIKYQKERLNDNFVTAHLYFFKADWEIGNKEQWVLCVDLQPSQFN